MSFEVDLKKNQGFEVDLSKAAPSLTELIFRVEWKEHPVHAASLKDGFDLDLSAYLLDEAGKIKAPENLLFFNNKIVADGAGILPADNRTGGDEGEEMHFVLAKIPAQIKQVDLYVNVYEAIERNQSFLMMVDAKAFIINKTTGEVVQTFALNDYATDNALHAVSLMRQGDSDRWTVKAVGLGANVQRGINDILANYF